MRILLVDHDSTALEKVARALRGVVELDCVSSKADAMMLIKQNSYDVLIACERASDGSGLDLLGRLGKAQSHVKRIFSAAPERLQLLGTRLQPFNVARTVSYPIDLEELWLALAAVTTGENASIEGTVEHIVMDETGIPGAKPSVRTNTVTTNTAPTATPPPATRPAPAAAQPAAVPAPVPHKVAASAAQRPSAPAAPAAAAVARPVPVATQPATAAAPAVATVAASAAAVATASGAATVRQVAAPAVEPEPAPVRRTATLATSQSVRAAQAAKAQAAAPKPAAAEATSASDDAVNEKIDAILSAHATPAPAAVKPKKGLRIAAIGGIAAAVAVAAIVAVLMSGNAEQPTQTTARTLTAAEAAAAATSAKAAELEKRIETALMQDDVGTATAAHAELSALQPAHPRLAFFGAALRRADELNSLNQAAPEASANNPAPRVTPPTPTPAPVRAEEPALAERAASTSRDAGAPSANSGRPSAAAAEAAKFSGRTLEEVAPAAPAKPPARTTARAQKPAAPAPAPAAPAIEDIGPTPSTAPPPVDDARAAVLRKRVSPEYPADAAARGVEGYVTVEFTVMTNGRVKDLSVVESNPRRMFDSAARDAVRRWQFDPATQSGVAVESKSRVRLDFRLKD